MRGNPATGADNLAMTSGGAEGAPSGSDARELRIVIVDDHEIVRSGLRSLIEQDPDLEVVGEAGTAAGAIAVTEEMTPDMVVMDLRLPDGSGIAACAEIVKTLPDTRVLILTSYADRAAVRASVAAGASGYMLKRVSMFDLVDALRSIARGEATFITDDDTVELGVREAEDTLLSRLSPQERIVAGYIARGLTNGEIADEMSLAEKTVKNYVSHLLTKMGFKRRSEAAAYIARIEAEADRWAPAGL